ncbi:MAG TPA: CoA-binding protein [Candidatus Hydrogenedentes bacterium]|nr:CoA-binding protein [Candidatus Hydrogenedentota bacterium]
MNACLNDSLRSLPPTELRQRFHALFEPASVAIVGASSSPLKWGFRILFNTIMGGYKGALYAVNPKHSEILGIPCYPSVSALPETVDLALIVLPPKYVVDAVRECAMRGVRAVIVITAGFGELDDPAAQSAQEELARLAAETGILLVGPNCAGVASPNPNSLYSGMLYRYPGGGGMSVVSQSGNVGMTTLTWAQLHQVGIARFVSSGNEAATRCEDYLRFFAHDAHTKAILAYVEGTRDGRRFFEALRETAACKPVVIVKGGRTDAGQRAAASHTGSLASAVTLFESACRQAGANVVDDIYQGMELASAFVHQPLPKGRRVVIVSEGGGWGVIGADACAAAGLEVIPLPGEIIRELDAILPGWWSRNNPIDLVAGNDRSLMSRSVEAVLKNEGVDAVLVLGVGYMCSRSARLRDSKVVEDLGLAKLIEVATNMELHDVQRISGLIDLYEKPIIAASDTVMLAYGPSPNEAIREMERLGVYAYASPSNAARTLAHLVERYEFQQRIPRRPARTQ